MLILEKHVLEQNNLKITVRYNRPPFLEAFMRVARPCIKLAVAPPSPISYLHHTPLPTDTYTNKQTHAETRIFKTLHCSFHHGATTEES